MGYYGLDSPPELSYGVAEYEQVLVVGRMLEAREGHRQGFELARKEPGRRRTPVALPEILMLEDAADQVRLLDRGDDFPGGATSRVGQGIDFLDLAEQAHPIAAPPAKKECNTGEPIMSRPGGTW